MKTLRLGTGTGKGLKLQISVKFPVYEGRRRTGDYYTHDAVIVEVRGPATFADLRDLLIKELELPHWAEYNFDIPIGLDEPFNDIRLENKIIKFVMTKGHPEFTA